ncbi:MAG: endonuclease domain-containing protein [Actinomycetota bacterium]
MAGRASGRCGLSSTRANPARRTRKAPWKPGSRPDSLLAIEVDGYRWHSGRSRWETDLARRNRLTSRGWRVLHVTAADIEHRPDELTCTIAAALAQPQPR